VPAKPNSKTLDCPNVASAWERVAVLSEWTECFFFNLPGVANALIRLNESVDPFTLPPGIGFALALPPGTDIWVFCTVASNLQIALATKRP